MKILLLGKDGQIGSELRRSLSPLGEVIAPERSDVDLTDFAGVRACVHKHRPALIVNAAAYTAVDGAESHAEEAHRINAQAVQVLAQEANRLGAWMVQYSTDYVFDGEQLAPYREKDTPNPLSVYGRTKLAGEEFLRKECPRHLILRTSWVYAARGINFPGTILRLARERETLEVVADQFGAPTSAALVADVTALALHQIMNANDSLSRAGTYHVAAAGTTSWHAYAQHIIALAQARAIPLKTSADKVLPIRAADYPAVAKRPRNSRLDTTLFEQTFQLTLPDWKRDVERLITEIAEPEAP